MLFNSLDFAIFLPIVFALYWLIPATGIRWRNFVLLAASYFFYAWWDWRFLGLIILSSTVDYLVAQRMGRSVNKSKRKGLLLISLAVNLGLLGFFKYYNFFIDGFTDAFTFFGSSLSASRLNIILPVGISFYTFQTLGYVIDVYRKKTEPSYNFINFYAFVSFFPQLVAGPIERANSLLPQFASVKNFEFRNGQHAIQQILWGLFKKMVIADNCALIVNQIFNDYGNYSGSTLLIGLILFGFQIYGDFSGYSDIAVGTARLFGFDLMQNFKVPYFSRSIPEFWRRWHISLSTWFRDYLYIPLGGNKGSKLLILRNVLLVFLISGFWHGANWNFVSWGVVNGLLFLPFIMSGSNRKYTGELSPDRMFPAFPEIIRMLVTFMLITLTWAFFRAESIGGAISYLSTIFSKSLLSIPYAYGVGSERTLIVAIALVFMLVIEWAGRNQVYALFSTTEKGRSLKNFLISVFLAMLLLLFAAKPREFIYFQF